MASRRARKKRSEEAANERADAVLDAAMEAGDDAISNDRVVGDALLGDALPEDLDITAYVGPYEFPNIRRRRIAASLYVVVAIGCVIGYVTADNVGLLAAAIALAIIAVYHWITAWPLDVDQTDALAVASRAVGFPIGHASAQLAWRGWLSRPTWRVLLYSADTPPSMRGLVELDAVDGEVLGDYTESNPEDWSKYDLA
jgi:hypothetical protein